MATVEKYETNAGVVRWRVRYRGPDHRQRKKSGFATKKDAERYGRSVETSKDVGLYVDPRLARVTVGELGPKWLAQQSHLKPSSRQTVDVAWRVQVEPRWGQTPINAITHSDVQTWVQALGRTRSVSTVKRAVGVLSGIFDTAMKDRRISDNPCTGIKFGGKPPPRQVFLDHRQVHALAAESGQHAGLVFVLAYCGLRWGEATGLRVRDIDRNRRRLNVKQNAVWVRGSVVVGTPKDHRERWVPYPALLDDHIREACRDKLPDALVFPDRHGDYLRPPYSVDGWFSGAVKRAGLDRMTPHDLRHTAASLAVRSGANVKTIQRILGHKTAAMTLDVYAGLFDDDLDAHGARLDADARASIT